MLILLPAVALLIVVFFYPLADIVRLSFTQPSVGFANYVALFTDGVTVTVLTRTLWTSALIALVTVLIAYPYTYAMTRVSPRARGLLTILVLIPFWTSIMARNFAWYLIEQRDGVIDQFLSAFGIHGVVLLGTLPGVAIAMVQVMLPFAVLPLYTSLSTIDTKLMDAAASCGAPKGRAFLTVYLPLSRPGLLSAFSLVLILSLGFYITPAILGSAQQSLVSQLIATRVTKLLDFGAGGALGMVLLAITLIVLGLVALIGRPTKGGARG
ncbi:ABC transporter permease [Mycobacterium sp. AT1]|nr:ABC transporter permease [Mycobacterium sp. AT1]